MYWLTLSRRLSFEELISKTKFMILKFVYWPVVELYYLVDKDCIKTAAHPQEPVPVYEIKMRINLF